MTRRAFFWFLAGLASLAAGIWPKAKPATLTLTSPSTLRYCDVKLSVSTDDGRTWRDVNRASEPPRTQKPLTWNYVYLTRTRGIVVSETAPPDDPSLPLPAGWEYLGAFYNDPGGDIVGFYEARTNPGRIEFEGVIS